MTSFFSSQKCQFCCCCCKPSFSLCCKCGLCLECCCCCPPSELPKFPAIPFIPPMPQFPCCFDKPCQPPAQVIREQVLVPYPYPVPVPVYHTPRLTCECDYDKATCQTPCDYNVCSPQSQRCSDDYHFAIPCYPSCPEKPKSFTCLPFPTPKRIHLVGQSLIPGYRGHIPGYKFHAAGRSFGNATRDTRCVMSQWDACCPRLPSRIWEQ